MKVTELGEFGLIELLANIINKSKNTGDVAWRQLLIGIGDDTAAWQDNGCTQLATTDSLVQDIHFNLDVTGWTELGWKAIAVNLSDIAAMGGTPRYALVSLALPGELEIECVSSLYMGMVQISNQFGIAIIGGDIVAASKVMISVTIIGNLKGDSMLTRSAAMPGDHIAVTGHLGLSAAGLRMLKENIDLDTETSQLLAQAHLRPAPRLKEGETLLKQGVRAAIDISDGLIADLAHICKASQVSARIEENSVPVHPEVQANFKADYQQLAMSGGEDYELLFTASKQIVDRVKQELDCPVTVIGEITRGNPGQVIITDTRGNNIPWQYGGWEHFKRQT